VGEFILRGKTFKVMRRTIGQELVHRLELEKMQKELKKFVGNGKGYNVDDVSPCRTSAPLVMILYSVSSLTGFSKMQSMHPNHSVFM